MVKPARALLPALALVLNAFVWGISWWPFRELQRDGVHPLWATALIYSVSLILLLLWKPGAGRGFRRQPLLWVLVLATGMTNVGFNWAVTVGDVVRVVLLFYLMPAWTVILAWPILGEKPTPLSLLKMALALTGVVVVLDTGGAWPVPEGVADWLSLAGGFSFALTNILLRKLHDVPAPARILAMFGGGAGTAAVAAFIGLSIGIVAPMPAPHVAWTAVGLALSLGFLISNVALQYGASRLNAHAGALIMLSEIVFASLSSVALGAAVLTVRTLVGGALILAAAVWSAWPAQQQGEPPIGAQ